MKHIAEWWKFYVLHPVSVLRFTHSVDGRRMLMISKRTIFRKVKWAYLFEVNEELDPKTNKPIPWSDATNRNHIS